MLEHRPFWKRFFKTCRCCGTCRGGHGAVIIACQPDVFCKGTRNSLGACQWCLYWPGC